MVRDDAGCVHRQTVSVGQWERFEQAFTATAPYANRYRDVALTAVFTHASTGTRLAVAGFWDGGTTWRVRVAPPLTGTWTYHTWSSDSGVSGQSGQFSCAPSACDLTLRSGGAAQGGPGAAPCRHGAGYHRRATDARAASPRSPRAARSVRPTHGAGHAARVPCCSLRGVWTPRRRPVRADGRVGECGRGRLAHPPEPGAGASPGLGQLLRGLE
jgi:hypothetical protein